MAATRLPGKPLADIAGQPMIVHVWKRAMEADIGRVIVATDDAAIADPVKAAGGEAVLTRTDHASGSDRIAEALQIADPDREIEFVVNLQGDLPALDPSYLTACVEILENGDADIATLAAIETDTEAASNPNMVKVVGTPIPDSRHLRALYFTRSLVPAGDGPYHHHIGIYAYRRAALEKFIALPPSHLEQRERLEQLRALEAGMRIEVAIVDGCPVGVDTPADLERARNILAGS
jgi:3-deoxy-manno-octulosonate cytidylyltransferase (CMP-KDO synthetase)